MTSMLKGSEVMTHVFVETDWVLLGVIGYSVLGSSMNIHVRS